MWLADGIDCAVFGNMSSSYGWHAAWDPVGDVAAAAVQTQTGSSQCAGASSQHFWVTTVHAKLFKARIDLWPRHLQSVLVYAACVVDPITDRFLQARLHLMLRT